MSGPESTPEAEPLFEVIRSPVKPALDMTTVEGLATWRRLNLPRRGWRVVGYEPAEPGRWIARPCEWCAGTIEAAAFKVAHVRAPRHLETCRACRLSLQGPEATPGLKIVATPDVRGRALEMELQRRRYRPRRSIDRVEITRSKNWQHCGDLRFRYVDPQIGEMTRIEAWFDDAAMGWRWEATFPDSTHREGGPVVSLQVASEQFLQAKHDWQQA